MNDDNDAPTRPPMIIDWECQSCGRVGVAVTIQDDPKSPGERAYLAHEWMLAGRESTRRPCKYPSLKWEPRP